MKILSFIIALVLIASVVVSYTTTEILAPSADFETQTSTSVNVSGMINATNYPSLNNLNHSSVNITIMNRSCSSCNYGPHSSYEVNVSNGSSKMYWNVTITLANGYNWIYLNFTNVTRTAGGVWAGASTAARIINIDTDMYLLNIGGLGKINISMDTGNLTSSGNLKIDGCLKYNCSGGSGCHTLGNCV